MKPTVWHLIGDKRAGGSNHLVRQLIDSPLSDRFEFTMLKLPEAKTKLKHFLPDLIIFHYPCAWKYLPDLVLLKRHSKLFIYDHHYCEGFEREQVSSRFRFRLMLRLAYDLADGVISVSQAQSQWMVSQKLIKASKVRIIPSASKLKEILKLEPKIPSQPLQLGAYGRFAPQKGFDVLLKAMALLPPEQFQLNLGGYGQDEELIYNLAEGLSHVNLIGTVTDVPSFLASCDVIIIPSRWEPWGLVCLEAKAAGKPVVASDVDGLSEQIKDCGRLVPPNNIQKLAEAIASLPQQDLTAWGQTGKALAFNAWNDFLQNWEEFLQLTVISHQKTKS
jgi:glycosyltransferase involved in cell wall biosynthesis